LLREDNADLRLTETGRNLGLVGDRRWQHYSEKVESLESEQQWMHQTWLQPDKVCQDVATEVLGQPLSKDARVEDLLRRPETEYRSLLRLPPVHVAVEDELVVEQLEIQARYSGYLERQQTEIERQRRNEETPLPADLDYANVRGLSNEACQKLNDAHPLTIGQAGRISGITPAAISLLLVHLKKRSQLAA